jgi:hypothetical protein
MMNLLFVFLFMDSLPFCPLLYQIQRRKARDRRMMKEADAEDAPACGLGLMAAAQDSSIRMWMTS